MPLLRRFVVPMVVALAAAGALAVATAQADNQRAPLAQTLAPTDVTNTSVILHGTVDAGRQNTTYWFDIGTTLLYGARTRSYATSNDDPVNVQSSVSALVKGVTYHARLVAFNGDGLSHGDDMTFTTTAPV